MASSSSRILIVVFFAMFLSCSGDQQVNESGNTENGSSTTHLEKIKKIVADEMPFDLSPRYLGFRPSQNLKNEMESLLKLVDSGKLSNELYLELKKEKDPFVVAAAIYAVAEKKESQAMLSLFLRDIKDGRAALGKSHVTNCIVQLLEDTEKSKSK